jgi:hypothetical protein
MPHERKNFNYQSATVDAVTQHFITSSRQAIASARKCWSNDEVMNSKLDAAFYAYKLEELKTTYPNEYIRFTIWYE